MSDVEGIGGIVTGAAIARAVEPGAGDSRGRTHEARCLNCGTDLTGPFCHLCGQHAHVHRTIGAWWHDFLHSVLHIDGKFWHTLPMLAWRPGELTRRYARGERARFISPLALFLFTVLAMFAAFSLFGSPITTDPTGVASGIEEEKRAAETRLEKLERERFIASASGKSTEDLDARIANVREAISLGKEFEESGMIRGATVRISDDLPVWLRGPVEKAGRNPELLLYKVQANAYKFSWALIPLSLPFLWALFLHRRRYRQEFTAYDHLVFVTYSIAFMSLALILLSALSALGAPSAVTVLSFIAILPVHIFRQLRGAYEISRFSAAWRTAILLVVAMFVLMMFLLMLVAIGTFG